MFVSKRKYDSDKLQWVLDSEDLKNELSFYKKELSRLKTVVKTEECQHRFSKWKQSKIENSVGDLNGMKVVCYRDKQVRKCKKCGFMEATYI